MERLNQVRDQVRATFESMSWGQRGGIAIAVLATVGAMVWIMASATAVPMRTLFADLEPDQMARVVQELDARGVRYDLRGERTVLVPEDQLYNARIHLAGQGVPSSGGAGFELFDETEFGMTAFTQRVNYQRAMENELARTIRALDSVRLARVHLVLPEDTLFEEDQQDPSASVVLTLDRGIAPNDAEIHSIRYLVSSAVEGLSADAVTIIDSMGRTLARPSEDEGLGGSVEALQAAREVEKDIEERIVEILEPVVGNRRVRASVRVELDTSTRSETVEEYDPDTVAVRTEQRSQQTSTRSEQLGGGAAGAIANLPGGGAAAGGGGEEATSQTEEQLAYEINSVIRQRVQNGFTVERLTAAVLIDAAGPAPAALAGDEAAPVADAAAVGAPAWTPEQLAQLTQLVENVVGFDEQRGDRVMVMQEAFVPEPLLIATDTPLWASPDVFVPALRYAVLLLGLLLLGLFVIRPVMGVLLRKPEVEPQTQLIGRTVAELEGQADGEFSPAMTLASQDEAYEELRRRVLEMTNEDADRASEVITEWIRIDAA